MKRKHKDPPAPPDLNQLQQYAQQRKIAGDNGPMMMLCQKILLTQPDDEYACINLGSILDDQGHFREAIELFQTSLNTHPDNANLLHNLSVVHAKLSHPQQAYDYAKRASELEFTNSNVWISLSNCARSLLRFDEVHYAIEKALQVEPNNLSAQLNLATYYLDTGRPHEAVVQYQKLAEQHPNAALVHNNLLLAMLYDEQCSVDEITTTSKRYSSSFDLPTEKIKPHTNTIDPWRRLKIAFIGADISSHAVSYFLEPVLARLDRSQYEIYAYHTLAEGDATTLRLIRYFDHYSTVAALSIDQLEQNIRRDQIDILIDFAGHTAGNGLEVMGKKPAPVQVTWLGYPGTTGLSNIDIRLTDEITDANAQDGDYSETLYFLPAPFCVYRPCLRRPIQRYWPEYQVQPTPALNNGFITFGSCNNFAKMGLGPLRLWGQILNAVPNSRLLIEAAGIAHKEVKAAFIDKCTAAGIRPEQLHLLERDYGKQYLIYHEIDIALDPFPLTGGTTTCDTLWMGVPMISMVGEKFRSRMSTSWLTAAGLSDWIADDGDDYVRKAVLLASDIGALNQRRMSLREHIEKSPIMDERLFSIYFDNAIRQAWINWCEKQGAVTPPPPEFELAGERVFISPGNHIPLAEHLQKLQSAVENKAWDAVYRMGAMTLESIPQQADALAALAEADFSNGYEMAISYMSCAVDAAPKRGHYYLRLAEMLIAKDEQQAAQQILQMLEKRINAGEIII